MSMVSRWLIVFVLLAASMPSQPVFAAGESDYEIPLSELKKVEKKKPKKAEARKRKEKKKAEAASQETPPEVPGTPDTSGQSAPLAPETAKPAADFTGTPDSAHISHEPYSYVVPGKRIVIKAIIGHEEARSVRCRFRALDTGGYASVAMARAPGSQFTYVATLPALEPGAQALRYRFIVVDATGNETFSQEFATPVKSTWIMPGWQQDPSKEPVRATLDDPRQPLAGFSDVVMENEDRK